MVATKIDKLNRNELEQSLRIIKSKYGPNVIPFSAITGITNFNFWYCTEIILQYMILINSDIFIGQGKKDIWRVIRDNMLAEEVDDDEDNDEDEIDNIISSIPNNV